MRTQFCVINQEFAQTDWGQLLKPLSTMNFSVLAKPTGKFIKMDLNFSPGCSM
jgi:hypothetical protein